MLRVAVLPILVRWALASPARSSLGRIGATRLHGFSPAVSRYRTATCPERTDTELHSPLRSTVNTVPITSTERSFATTRRCPPGASGDTVQVARPRSRRKRRSCGWERSSHRSVSGLTDTRCGPTAVSSVPAAEVRSRWPSCTPGAPLSPGAAWPGAFATTGCGCCGPSAAQTSRAVAAKAEAVATPIIMDRRSNRAGRLGASTDRVPSGKCRSIVRRMPSRISSRRTTWR